MPEQLRPESKDLGEAATFIPNSSFLIPHSRKAFIHNQWTEPPKELTLNPIHLFLINFPLAKRRDI